jgi:threonine dehydratase
LYIDAVCDPAAVAGAIRILFECNHVVAESSGATALAGALPVKAAGPIVCVVTGGNIDKAHLITILEGGIPANQGNC